MVETKALDVVVNETGVKTTADVLGRLATNADKAASKIVPLKQALEGLSGISMQGVALDTQALGNALNVIRNGSQGFTGLGNALQAAARGLQAIGNTVAVLQGSPQIFSDAAVKATEFANALSTMKARANAATQAMIALNRASQNMPHPPNPPAGGGGGSGGSGGSGGGGSGGTNATQQQRYLNQLEREAYILNNGRRAWLEYRAAQLGVQQQAAPFIHAMNNSTNALNITGMSAGAVNNALRYLPAQFTDIATQLAGGQSPFLVLLQQGGQVKDMFGSVGNAAKAMGYQLMKYLTNPYILAAAAIASVGAAYYYGSEGAKNFQRTLDTTNGVVGISVEQFRSYVALLNNSTGRGKFAIEEALDALAASGKVTSDQLERLTVTTANFAAASGKDIKDVVADFTSLGRDPATAVVALNEKYHFLTEAVYEQIKALQDNNNTAEAVKVAMAALADADDAMTARIVKNRGAISRWWESMKGGYYALRDAILSIGDEESAGAVGLKLAEKKAQLAALQNQQSSGGAVNTKHIDAVKRQIDDYQKQYDSLKKTEDATNAASRAEADKQRQNEKATEAEKRLSDARLQHSVNSVKLAKALEQLKKDEDAIRAVNPNSAELTTQAHAAAVEAIKKQYEDKSNKNSGTDAVAPLLAQEQALQANIASLKELGSAYDKTTESEQKLWAIQYKLKNGDYKAEEKAALQAQVPILERIIALEKTQDDLKAGNAEEKSWIEKTAKAEAYTKSLQDQITEINRGSTATGKLTATQKQLAEAQKYLGDAKTYTQKAAALDAIDALKEAVANEQLATDVKAGADAIKALTKTRADHQAAIQNTIDSYRQEESQQFLSNREKSIQNTLLSIEADRLKTVAEIKAEIARLDADPNGGHDAQKKALQSQIAEADQYAADRKAALASRQQTKTLVDTDYLATAKASWQDFYDGLSNSKDVFTSGMNTAYSSMQDTLFNFFTTGKSGWREFAVSAMQNIAKIATQLLILKAIQYGTSLFAGGSTASVPSADYTNAMSTYGTMGGVPSAHGNAFVNGLVAKFAKGGAFTNSIVRTATPIRFAQGAGFGAGVIGEKGGNSPGEAVMPLARTSTGDLGVKVSGDKSSNPAGGNIYITVSVNSDGSSSGSTSGSNDAADLRTIGNALTLKIKQVITEEKRPGGILAT